MNVNTYLFFNGRCEEAIQFYCDCLEAESQFIMRYKDGPSHLTPPNGENLIFHATVKIGESVVNMCDLIEEERASFTGFALLVHVETSDRAEATFEGLRHEGQVKMPLQQTPWAQRYGIVVDKFGVTWKVQVNA